LSSAILYLAIVVIWAFLLVPRWIRRPHVASLAGADEDGGELEQASAEGDALFTGDPALPGVRDAADDPHGPRLGILRAVGLAGARRPLVDDAADDVDGQARESQWREADWQDQPEPDTAPLAPITVPGPGATPAPAGAPESASAPPGTRSGPVGPPRRPVPGHPPISRAKILQARRRLLTMLVLLAVAAATFTMLKLTSAWVCVPPAVMLGMYVLLLRETALADAETAHWRAEQAHAARERNRARSRQAWAARTPQPTAEIIDISARLTDQLYDQYADATVRAVGD
jgi:hypothetical protein